MNLRPYQIVTCDKIRAGWDNFSKQLAVLPTGSGKTIISANVTKEFSDRGERVLFLAHREELLTQTLDKFRRAVGINAELEKAEHRASLTAPVVVASVQTMTARGTRWPQDHFDLIIVDEAHHAIADSYRSVLARFDGTANVLGITASPDRSDKRNLGSYFEAIADEVGLFDLIRDGYLSRITIKSIPLRIDLGKVNQTTGDYDAAQLGETLEPYLDQIAVAIRDHAHKRRTLVFLPLIATSQKFVEACRKAGLRAEHVDGYSEDRAEKLTRFARGEFDILCNAMLLTEGYDDPAIDCVLVLRPTRSRALYSQMVGRGTRTSPGKENLLLLDFLWNHSRLNLVRPAHLVAKTEEEAEIITQLAEEKSDRGATQEELELEGLATETAEKRHEALRKKLENNRKKKLTHVDAEEWCMKMGRADLTDYEPVMEWEAQPVTEKQAWTLKRAGLLVETVKGKGHASKLIDAFKRNQKLVSASTAQKDFMRRRGHPNWETATAADASQFFAQLRR